MGIQRNINPHVIQNLKEVYFRDYQNRPESLVKALNKKFPEHIDKRKGASENIVSPRTIRNFFDAEDPSINSRTLELMTQLMLGLKYDEAVEIHVEKTVCVEKTEPYSQNIDLSNPFFIEYKDKTRKRVEHVAVLDVNNRFELDFLYTGTYFVELEIRKELDYVEALKSILPEQKSERNYYINNHKPLFGLEQVAKEPRLLLVGRAGIGKTIFAKKVTQVYLDSFTSIRHFGKEVLPIYLPLKVCDEEILEIGLKQYLVNDFCSVFNSSGNNCRSQVWNLLNSGQALIVLDALDETGNRFSNLCREIEKFINDFPDCRIIITSRLSTSYPNFPGFKKWEIKLFTDNQSRAFIEKLFMKLNWLEYYNKSALPEDEVKLGQVVDEFFQKFPKIATELKYHPLSIIYMGMLHLENYGMSRSISEICENVIDIFLRKWDLVRNIRTRIPGYRDRLSRLQKVNLFCELAFDGLKDSNTAWKEETVKKYITSYLGKISIIANQSDLEKDVESMLEVFIMDDGLLVPATRGYFSFPFLIFQEYLSARYLLANQDIVKISRFIQENLLEEKWRNTIIMYSELSPNADRLFFEIFNHIHKKFSKNQKLQEILHATQLAAQQCNLNTTSWRAHMLMLDHPLDLLISRQSPLPDDDLIGISQLTKKFNEQRHQLVDNQPKFVIALYLAIAYALVQDKYLNQENDKLALEQSHPIILDALLISESTGVSEEIQRAVDEARGLKDKDLIRDLHDLQNKIPQCNSRVARWESWSQSLISLMQRHLYFGHSIHLNPHEIDEIKQYFYAVRLLLQCLTSINIAKQELREWVFDHLLLPADLIFSIPNFSE